MKSLSIDHFSVKLLTMKSIIIVFSRYLKDELKFLLEVTYQVRMNTIPTLN